MMNSDRDDNAGALHPAGRSHYEPPRLSEFGAVGALTQSGTTTQAENMNNMLNGRPPMS